MLSPKQFFPYDLDEPDVFPESLKEKFDIVVADPPFLNEVCLIVELLSRQNIESERIGRSRIRNFRRRCAKSSSRKES